MSAKRNDTLLTRYQRLIELSRHLASTLNLEALLDQIVHAAADLCDAEAASILLYDSVNHQLYFEATTNLDAQVMHGLVVPVENSVAGWIVTQRQPVILNEAQKDPRLYRRVAQATQVETRSLLGVPLITKDKVIGVLEAINKRSGQFTLEDQEVLVALGSQAAVAIENARLFHQSDLISELVHEIRTPLAALKAASHLLSRSETTPQQRSALVQTIQREINRLSEMATAFLDVARLESGRLEFRQDEVDVAALLEECIQVVASRAEERQQHLQLRLTGTPPQVRGDRDKLKQAMLNLLSNAIKYTPEGGAITVSASSEKDWVRVCVSDTGLGIPAEHLPFIFEKFYRVPDTLQTAQGSGLGLFIVKRIIEAHGGRVEAKSSVGEGTQMTVWLPLIKAK